jgi:VRR-NUC domain
VTDVLRLVSEADLQATVEALLDLYGYLSYHTYDSRRSRPGFPDLAAIRPGGTGSPLWLLELKTETGRLRPAQARWGEALAASPTVRYAVIRPADLPQLVEDLR